MNTNIKKRIHIITPILFNEHITEIQESIGISNLHQCYTFTDVCKCMLEIWQKNCADKLYPIDAAFDVTNLYHLSILPRAYQLLSDLYDKEIITEITERHNIHAAYILRKMIVAEIKEVTFRMLEIGF